jgi:hypothetical protein
MDEPSRRRFIAAAATISGTALAGCVEIGSVENDFDEIHIDTDDVNIEGNYQTDGSDDDSDDESDSGNDDAGDEDAGEEELDEPETENGSSDPDMNGDASPSLVMTEYRIHHMGFTNVFEGTVENASDDTLEDVVMEVTLYDDDGDELDLRTDAEDTVDSLEPGETWEFSITAVGARFSEMDDYEFTFTSA